MEEPSRYELLRAFGKEHGIPDREIEKVIYEAERKRRRDALKEDWERGWDTDPVFLEYETRQFRSDGYEISTTYDDLDELLETARRAEEKWHGFKIMKSTSGSFHDPEAYWYFFPGERHLTPEIESQLRRDFEAEMKSIHATFRKSRKFFQ